MTWELRPVVDALYEANTDLVAGARRHSGRRSFPSRDAITTVVAGLRAVLFPWHFGSADISEEGLAYYVGHTLDAALAGLREQVHVGLLFDFADDEQRRAAAAARAVEVTQAFASALPALRATLGGDARAAYEGDPAATSVDEAVFCYAGFNAIVHHRIAHALSTLGVPLIPRIISELAHATTGIDIHPGARIGGSFFIDHGTGVVIGETCVIGERVRLYQGVTLGAKSFPTDARGHPVKGIDRHPVVEDDVIIYAGATVLGRITVGRGSTIGGNVWLTHSVPPGTHVRQAEFKQQAFEGGGGI